MLPWTTFLYWLSCVASLLMRFLVMTGSPPSDFPSRAKVRMQDVVVFKIIWMVYNASCLMFPAACNPHKSYHLYVLQLKEVLNVVDHLHQREDNYRRKIKVLNNSVIQETQ